jgi:hypothetical protein
MVGTMPEIIHVPPMAPINKRIMMAGVQLAILLVISRSRFSHTNRFEKWPTNTLIAEATKSET